MDAQQIKTFIDAMAASDLAEMEVSHEGWTLRLSRSARTAPARAPGGGAGRGADEQPARTATHATGTLPEAPAAAARASELQAPLFGIVHFQPAPGEPPFVRTGDLVEEGQMICTIEAMKVFNEVRAERAGRIGGILVGNGSEVEAGQALLVIEQAGHV